MKIYDLVIIGSGSGLNIASKAIENNKKIKIAIIEKDKMGGTCLNRGCIPSKMLLHYSDVIETIKKSDDFFIKSNIKKIDYKKIITDVNNQINKDSLEILSFYKKNKKIDLYQCEAKFLDNHKIKVKDKIIYAKKIVIAIGARPNVPKIEGLDKIDYLTYVEALKLKKLPKDITIIGGGYIGVELSLFFYSMGVKVSILEKENILSGLDNEIVAEFKKDFLKKIKVFEKANIKKIDKKNNKAVIFFNNKKIESEKVLVVAGIKPNTDLIDIENTDIKLDRKGFIKVDKYLQTSVKHIYAFGDCIDSYFFKHSANFEAKYIYSRIFERNRERITYPNVGYSVFSNPEIAGVGLKLKEIDDRYFVKKAYFKDIAQSMICKGKAGIIYLIFEKKTKRLKGSHMVCKNASILIHVLIAFMEKRGKLDDMKKMIYIHPSFAEIIKRGVLE
jgi:dihydrolipoamide dehydrogenase